VLRATDSDRVRDSVVASVLDSSATARRRISWQRFAASTGGYSVTNYHVVLAAVLYPRQYRLEFLAPNGANGKLSVHAIDVEQISHRQKRKSFTRADSHSNSDSGKGERAYSIGFRWIIGLTITEGVANGLVENSLKQRIHYSGANERRHVPEGRARQCGCGYGSMFQSSTGRQL